MKTSPKQLIIATGNPHKVAEFHLLLEGLGFEVLPATACDGMPAVEEDGDSFAANARIKAEALRRLAPEGTWVMADDSGLEVDALGGAPGVYSARYAGPEADDAANLEKLLRELVAVPETERTARFRCVLCLIAPDGHEWFFEGTCEGRIAAAAHGSEGFGYDPVFIPEGYTESFGQLGEAVKSRLSHRARAAVVLRKAV